MAELPINYLDTGKVARDKINDSFQALETTVAGYRPHIEDGIWWIGTTNTGVKAVGDSISMKVEDGYIWYKSSSTNSWTQIIATSAIKGDTGNGIDHTTSSKIGKTTTVVMHYTNGGSDSFTVQDGADGQDVGYIVGPESSTNGNVVLFDGTTGKLAKDSGIQLGTAASKDTGTTSGKIPVLDSDGKISSNLLPAIAITDTFTVSTSSDLTSLSSAEKGDIAIATTENKTYILSADPYSTASNWKELATPTGAVSSVNSKTGVVILDADDISDSTTTNKFTNATEKSTWSGKQDKLVAGSNITIASDGKTISATDTTYTATDFDIKDLADSTSLRTTWSAKQDALVSGTNIKTINNNSILGDGNLTVSGLPSGGQNGQIIMMVNGVATWVNPADVGFRLQASDTEIDVPYVWSGTEDQYAARQSYSDDTEYHTV